LLRMGGEREHHAGGESGKRGAGRGRRHRQSSASVNRAG
jgi:hypothetical protein